MGEYDHASALSHSDTTGGSADKVGRVDTEAVDAMLMVAVAMAVDATVVVMTAEAEEMTEALRKGATVSVWQ